MVSPQCNILATGVGGSGVLGMKEESCPGVFLLFSGLTQKYEEITHAYGKQMGKVFTDLTKLLLLSIPCAVF